MAKVIIGIASMNVLSRLLFHAAKIVPINEHETNYTIELLEPAQGNLGSHPGLAKALALKGEGHFSDLSVTVFHGHGKEIYLAG